MITNIAISSITPTTYEDNTSWVSYSFNDEHGNSAYSYEIIDNSISTNTEAILKIIEANIPTKYMIDHLVLAEGIKDRFTDIIQGDNDMCYLEGYDDFDFYFNAYTAEEIKTVVDRIKLSLKVFEDEGYVEYTEVTDKNLIDNEPLVTIYGGIVTRLIFS